jgi:hypothetical protein
VILVNSANYTAWDLRWRCLRALPGACMAAEAAFLERMLELNPKNYQLWNYRRRFAFHRGAPHAAEARQHASGMFLSAVCSRTCCVFCCVFCMSLLDKCRRRRLDAPARSMHAGLVLSCSWESFAAAQDLAYVDRCLGGDDKNYHAWAHRAAVAERFGLWRGEPAATAAWINRDVRNNSAWSHRFAAVSALAKQCVLCY